MTVHSKDVKIQITDKNSTSVEDETMVDTGNGTLWEIDDRTKDVWDPSAEVTVEVDTGTGYSVKSSGYTEHYLTGQIEFDNDQSGNDVRVDINYFDKFTVAEASSATMSISNNLSNPSILGDDGENRKYGREDVSFELERVNAGTDRIDGSGGSKERFLELLLNSSLVVLQMQTDTTQSADNQPVLRAYTIPDTQSIDIPGDDLVSNSMSFMGDQLDKNSNNLAAPQIARFKQGV